MALEDGAELLEEAPGPDDACWLSDDDATTPEVAAAEDAPAEEDGVPAEDAAWEDAPADVDPPPCEVPPMELEPDVDSDVDTAADVAVLLPVARLEDRPWDVPPREDPPDGALNDDADVAMLVATPPLELVPASIVPHSWSAWQV